MPYTLKYGDRFLRQKPPFQASVEFSPREEMGFLLSQDDINHLEMIATGSQLTKITSAAMWGAQLLFPDDYADIALLLEQMLRNPIAGGFDDSEVDCFNFAPSAPFVAFYPQDPYNQPDLIPDDYVVPPFFVNSDEAYPFLFGYLASDVFINPSAINIDPIDLVTLNLPQIQLRVVGSGQIEFDFLAVTGGSMVVIKAGSPPNISDIVDGIVDTGATIIDLELEGAIPPESDIVTNHEMNIDALSGVETIVYVVFVPVIDDSFVPTRLGGGIRQIGLCGFEDVATMGIEDVRFNTGSCTFEKRVGGVWVTMDGGDEWLDCVPEGGGGGGGGGALATVHKQDLGAATVTSTATSLAGVTGSSFNHTFTKSKAIVICHAYVQHSGASAVCQIRASIAGATFVDNSYQEWIGTNLRVLAIANSFEAIPLGVNAVALSWFTSGGTMTMNNSSLPQFIILEFDDASELFVEDIRIVDNELQKKIAGVWVPVVDSLADILDGISAQAAAALAAATNAQTVNASQQTQINAILAVNTAQTNLLTAHGVRLDDIDLSIAGLNAQVIDHEARIDALEAAGSLGGYWSQEIDFTASDQGWTGNESAGWFSGDGWLSSSGIGVLEISKPSVFISDQRVTHMKLWLRATSGATPNTYLVSFAEYAATGGIYLSGLGTQVTGWYKVPNRDGAFFPYIRIFTNPTVNDFQLEKVQFLGRGSSPSW